MRRHSKVERNEIRKKVVGTGEFDEVLDTFLALDRTVVELFMQVYQTPADRRSAMRVQNRRLHSAISKPLLRLLSHGASVSRKRQSVS